MMEKRIKYKIYIKGIILIGLLIFSIAFFIYSSSRFNKLSRRQTILQSQVKQFNDKISNFNSRIDDITQSLIVWKNLTNTKENFEGVSSSTAKEILDNLENNHKVETKKTMSKPVMLAGNYSGKYFLVESSTISLSLSSYSDVHMLYFVFDLLRRFPGYIKITEFSVKKRDIENEEFITKIVKGEKIYSVNAKITFDWRELKEIQKP
mgnify:FL=1|jgi:hypothetical protein